jgi:ribonuclease HI
MKHIAWFDGSHTQKGDAYFAYTISNEFGETISEYKAEVKGVKNSNEAEFAGLIYLLKKFEELKVEEYDIFTDSQNLVHSLNKGSKKHRFGVNHSLQIERYFGTSVLEKVVKNLHWKERKYNLADRLFKKIKKYDVIEDFIEIFCSTLKIRNKKEKNKELIEIGLYPFSKKTFKRLKQINGQDFATIDIPDTSFVITEKCLKLFSKSFETSKNPVLEHVSQNIKNSIVTSKENVTVMVRGKLRFFCKENTIFSYELIKN